MTFAWPSLALDSFAIQWRDLLAAAALYLVMEGILPFLSPDRARRAFVRLSQMGNTPLRVSGLISMLAGITLLYFARHSL